MIILLPVHTLSAWVAGLPTGAAGSLRHEPATSPVLRRAAGPVFTCLAGPGWAAWAATADRSARVAAAAAGEVPALAETASAATAPSASGTPSRAHPGCSPVPPRPLPSCGI